MSDDTTLVIERILPADPETVFEAWTNPDILAKWWGPDGVTIPNHELDVRPGGKWSTTMHSDEMGNRTVSGEYRTIDPPKRLVFTWGWIDDDGTRGHETEVDVTFDRIETGTRMKLVQTVFENAHQRDMHNMGWDSSFDCLERSLGELVS